MNREDPEFKSVEARSLYADTAAFGIGLAAVYAADKAHTELSGLVAETVQGGLPSPSRWIDTAQALRSNIDTAGYYLGRDGLGHDLTFETPQVNRQGAIEVVRGRTATLATREREEPTRAIEPLRGSRGEILVSPKYEGFTLPAFSRVPAGAIEWIKPDNPEVKSLQQGSGVDFIAPRVDESGNVTTFAFRPKDAPWQSWTARELPNAENNLPSTIESWDLLMLAADNDRDAAILLLTLQSVGQKYRVGAPLLEHRHQPGFFLGLQAALMASKHVGLVVSEQALTDPLITRSWSEAMHRDPLGQKRGMIPFTLDNVDVSQVGGLAGIVPLVVNPDDYNKKWINFDPEPLHGQHTDIMLAARVIAIRLGHSIEGKNTRPVRAPRFPGRDGTTDEAPFPGQAGPSRGQLGPGEYPRY